MVYLSFHLFVWGYFCIFVFPSLVRSHSTETVAQMKSAQEKSISFPSSHKLPPPPTATASKRRLRRRERESDVGENGPGQEVGCQGHRRTELGRNRSAFTRAVDNRTVATRNVFLRSDSTPGDEIQDNYSLWR